MCKLNLFDKISVILVLLGSINWGVIGILGKNIFSLLFANSNILLRMIYILIFISAINLISLIFRCNISKSLT